jgi:hypothetical protein
MKQIQPISIWVNGEEKTGQFISTISNDNLATSALFYWQIYEGITDEEGSLSNGQQLAQGNVSMDGQDYIDWNADPDINQAAYIWVCNQLNLTLV